MAIDVTDENFSQEVLDKSKDTPVVVQFWASWCGPCNALKPVLEKVSGSYGDRMVLARLSVEENPDTAGEYQVRSIPHVALFKDGKIVDDFIGAKPESDIKEFLDKNL
jgi:putative thioredoxin